MSGKPAGLIYGLEDRPPWPVLSVLTFQHIVLMSSTLVLPVVLVTEIGGSFTQICAVVAFTMMACGVGTVLQALSWRGVGSGFLCPNLCGPNFFAISMSAAWVGGLPLVRGMTIVAGLVEVVFARLLRHLAFLFPTEITGLVVFMVAMSLVPLGAAKFLHVNYAGDPIRGGSLAVAAITLVVMVGANIWGSRRLKLYSVLLGMVVGYLLSVPLGVLTGAEFSNVLMARWIGLPDYPEMWHLSFDWTLLPGFVIVSICGALKSFGNLVMCEKVNDSAWREPDIPRIGDGLVADGLAVAASGLLGGLASDTSASNVALSSASGATSRWIAYAAGGLFFLLGFSPKLGALLSVMPAPVAGAILVYVVCFMIVSGLQIILHAKMDAQATFVIGISLAFGLSLDMVPELYIHVPEWLRPLFTSSLTLSAVLAVGLNLLLRLGAHRRRAAKIATHTAAEGG
jgi:NCS2 family nucleobase:cation symporter-2